MARIRTVKIGFFRNEDLCVFGFAHRLLFEGLWLLADKAGRLEDRPKRIHADIFPFDLSLDVGSMLDDLAGGECPFIERYQVAGKAYIQVLNFLKHQRPHATEPVSTIPASETSDALVPPSHDEYSPCDNGEPQYGREGKGKEGKEEGKERDLALTAPVARPEALRDAWNDGTSKPIPQCLELSEKRRKGAIARLAERTLDVWRVVIGRINASPFCRGENDRQWIATFDWLLQPDTAVKVLEGKYDARKRAAPTRREVVDWSEECARLHGGRCTNAHFHDAEMAKARAS